MANALRANFLAHFDELRCTIGIDRFNDRLRSFEVAESFDGILELPVTDGIRHRKLSGVVLKREAILFTVDASAVDVFGYKVIAGDALTKTSGS